MAEHCIFPAEIISYILGYLDPRQVVRSRLVSKWFRDITYDVSIWRNVYANSCLPRPPGPFPFQSTAYLERKLVRTEKLAQSWTTRPMRITPRVELRTKKHFSTGLLDGRCVVGCELHKRIVLYEPASSAGTLSHQRYVIWKEEEESVEVKEWSKASIITEDGQLVLYVLLGGIHRKLNVPMWRLLEFRMDHESSRPHETTVFDVPVLRLGFHIGLRCGKSPFLCVWNGNLVFDTRTHTFYEFPEFRIALDETRCKIDADITSFIPNCIMLTRTHVIVIHEPSGTMALIQAFTVDGSSVRNDKTFLRLSHEGVSNHLYRQVTLLRNSIVDPVTGSTNVRLFSKDVGYERLCIVLNDLMLPESTGEDILPITINVTDEKTSNKWDRHNFCDARYHADCSDAGYLRGFLLQLPVEDFLDPQNSHENFCVLKFSVDATRDDVVTILGDILTVEYNHIANRISAGLGSRNDPAYWRQVTFDGPSGQLSYIRDWDSDSQVMVIADIE